MHSQAVAHLAGVLPRPAAFPGSQRKREGKPKSVKHCYVLCQEKLNFSLQQVLRDLQVILRSWCRSQLRYSPRGE